MRILFLTNFYLPYRLGEEEKSCQQIVQGLNQRERVMFIIISMQ